MLKNSVSCKHRQNFKASQPDVMVVPKTRVNDYAMSKKSIHHGRQNERNGALKIISTDIIA